MNRYSLGDRENRPAWGEGLRLTTLCSEVHLSYFVIRIKISSLVNGKYRVSFLFNILTWPNKKLAITLSFLTAP